MKTNKLEKITIGIVGTLLLFHFGIVFKIIPYEIVWGGRLQSDQEMYVFESISIALNLLLALLLLAKVNLIAVNLPEKVINFGLWAFVGLFALNTIGNLLAETTFEKFFSIATIYLCISLWMIIKRKAPSTSE